MPSKISTPVYGIRVDIIYIYFQATNVFILIDYNTNVILININPLCCVKCYFITIY